MATIKAGTYRFNDVLTIPIEPVSAEINFTTNIGEDGSILAECLGFIMAVSDFDSASKPMGISLRYYVNSLEPNPGFEVPDECTVYFADSTRNKRWYTDSYGDGIKTITIPNDTEVSSEFYEWFTENAVNKKEISGVWKFNDVLRDYAHINENVNYTCNAYSRLFGVEVLANCSGIASGAFAGEEVNGLYCRVESTVPDLSAYGFVCPRYVRVYQEDGWNTGAFDIKDKCIYFGTTPQYVSIDFYNWLTANAVPVMASITHNGSTIAELFPGQTATLKCKGMKMEDDVVVAVGELPETEIPEPKLQEKTATENGEVLPDEGYDGLSKVTVAVESSGGGLAINGIIEQYKVNAGATVNAGDFVEFVNKFGSGTFDSNAMYNNAGLSACRLDNSRVLIAYSDGGSSGYGKAVVLSLDDTEAMIGAEVTFEKAEAVYISAVALSADKALVAYSKSNAGYAVVLTIDGTTITVGEVICFSGVTVSYISAVALSEEKVAVCYYKYQTYAYGDPSKNLYCTTLTVADTTATVGVSSSVVSSVCSFISAVALSENRVFVTYVASSYLYCKVLLISDESVSTGSAKSLCKANASNTYNKAVKLTENKVLVAYCDTNGSSYGKAVVLTTDDGGTTLTIGTAITFNSAVTYFISAVALSEDEALVVYRDAGNSNYGTVIVLMIDGTTITVGEEKAFALVSTNYSDVVAFSESSVLVAHDSGAGLYTGLTIDGTNITVDGAGKYVKPATGRLHNVGVAATGGAEGETVDVYVVG